MSQIEKLLDSLEVHPEFENLRGPALQVFMQLMVCVVLLSSVVSAEEDDGFPKPYRLADHPANKENKNLELWFKISCAAMARSELKDVFPFSDPEIASIVALGNHLKIPKLQDPKAVELMHYADINLALKEGGGDAFSEIFPPSKKMFGVPLDRYHTPVTTDVLAVEEAQVLYMDIPNLIGDNIVPDVKKILENHAECTHIILDLRNNGGGQTTVAVGLLDLFFKKGIAMYEYGKPIHLKDDGTERIPPGGFIVIANNSTASAGEIAWRGFDKFSPPGQHVSIGKRTLGKYSMQIFRSLESGVQWKYTIGFWLPENPGFGNGFAPDFDITELMKILSRVPKASSEKTLEKKAVSHAISAYLQGKLDDLEKQIETARK